MAWSASHQLKSTCIILNLIQLTKFNIMENPFEEVLQEIRSLKSMYSDSMKVKAQNTINLPEIMSVEETAEFLRTTKGSIYQQVSKGTIPFFKPNERVLFRRSVLLNWLDQFKQIDIHTANQSCNDFMASKR